MIKEDFDIIDDDLDLSVEEKDYTTSINTKNKHTYEEIDFEIIENFGNLSDKPFSPVFSLIKWNGFKKYDLRIWNGLRPGKGETFNYNELCILYNAINNISITDINSKPIAVSRIDKLNVYIYNHIETLSISDTNGISWTKEINIVSWGYSKEKKVDIRSWMNDYKRCGKGITISFEELSNLKIMLDKIFNK